MRKKVMILFPDGNLPYSPTIINLIRFLADQFDVSILAQRYSKKADIDTAHFTFIPFEYRLTRNKVNSLMEVVKKIRNRVYRKIGLKGDIPVNVKQDLKVVAKKINAIKPDIIIAVDLFALFCCEKFNIHCVFLSLEIPTKSIFQRSLSYANIDRVLIQSKERYDNLFNEVIDKPPYFVLPNAPVFKNPEKRTISSRKLIYNGYIWSAFGPQFCLSFITKFPEYELHLKGAFHHNENMMNNYFPFLLNTKSLIIETEYLSQEELNNYLQQFSIGFCFYNFEHPFIKENAFNYLTAPSGKLFTYLGIGLPVICSDIKAFKIVEKCGAGILIDDYSPDNIKITVDKILNNYKFYSDNALKLAERNCFKKNIEPFIGYLLKSQADN